MLLKASLLLLLSCVPVVAGILAEVPDELNSQLLLKFILSMLLPSLQLLVSLLLLAFLPLVTSALVVAGILAGIPGVAGVPVTANVHAVDGVPEVLSFLLLPSCFWPLLS
jgi:hypothetical protein